MREILVLGGGVGGTLAANLIGRKLKSAIAKGEARVRVVDETGIHVYQPGFMYIAMGGESAATLHRPERSLLDARIELVTGRIAAIDEAAQEVRLADGDRKSTRLNSSHVALSRMPSSA